MIKSGNGLLGNLNSYLDSRTPDYALAGVIAEHKYQCENKGSKPNDC